jgi:hypothetical protein
MKPLVGAGRTGSTTLLSAAVGLALIGCAGTPLIPFSTDTPPLVLAPATQAGVQDKRGRFREIYCAVLQARASEVPDYRPCDDALTRLGAEPPATGQPVPLGASSRHLVAAVIPGIGWDCIAKWLQPAGTTDAHVRKFGYELRAIQVDALSSSANNARQIRDAVMAMDLGAGAPRLVLVGYSKGAPDALEAIVNHPEIRPRLAAVVSVAGSVGGSPLANDAEQYQADLMRHFPGATCDSGDGGGVNSLRTGVRRAWLAQNPLPASVPTYSVVTLPEPHLVDPAQERRQVVDDRWPQRQPDDLLRSGHPRLDPDGLRERGPLGDRGADRARARHDRFDVRHAECLSARGPHGSGASFRRRGPCRAREVAARPTEVLARSQSSTCAAPHVRSPWRSAA